MTSKSRALGQLEFVCLAATITSLTAFSIDALLPALRVMGESLGVQDMRNTQFLVSIFIVGMVFGELVFGPVADAIGRKPTILIGLAIYCIGSVIAVASQSFELVLLGRCIQGFGVSGPKIATRALIRDVYEGDAMARIMSLVFTVFILVPMIAPAVGQLTLELGDWRTIFAVYIAFALLCGIWLSVRQPETLATSARIPLKLSALMKNAGTIVRHPRVMACTLAAGALFGGQLLFLSVAQSVFLDVYGIAETFPAYFAVLAFALGAAALTNSAIVTRFGMMAVALTALSCMCTLSVVYLGTALFYSGSPPLWLFMTACFLVFACVGMLLGNISALAMQSLGELAGLGASLMAAISSGTAFLMASAIGRFYQSTVTVIGIGFLVASVSSLTLMLKARRMEIVPVRADGMATPAGV